VQLPAACPVPLQFVQLPAACPVTLQFPARAVGVSPRRHVHIGRSDRARNGRAACAVAQAVKRLIEKLINQFLRVLWLIIRGA
jgi:hypothetical protein